MALLWMEGFEHMTTAATAAEVAANLNRSFSFVDIPGTGNPIVTSRTGFVGIELENTDDLFTPYLRQPDDPDTTCIFGFYMKTGSAFSDFLDFIQIRTASLIQCSVEWNTGGTLDFHRGTTTNLGTSTFAFAANTEYYVEFKIVVADGTSGSLEMKVADLTANGDDASPETQWTVTGVDSRVSINAFETSWNRVGFICGTNGGKHVYDDFYVCDGSGSTNNDFLGNCYVETIRPNGVGSSSGFTPSAGSNYQNVDDTDQDGNDGDTTYNDADADSEEDLYAMEDITETGEIYGVQVEADVKVTAGNPRNFTLQARHGTTTGASSGRTILHDDYRHRRAIFETNPNTATAWENSEIGSAEFGIKRTG